MPKSNKVNIVLTNQPRATNGRAKIQAIPDFLGSGFASDNDGSTVNVEGTLSWISMGFGNGSNLAVTGVTCLPKKISSSAFLLSAESSILLTVSIGSVEISFAVCYHSLGTIC